MYNVLQDAYTVTMSGSREAMQLFAVNQDNGEVTVRSDLSTDSELSYTVSDTIIEKNHHHEFLLLSPSFLPRHYHSYHRHIVECGTSTVECQTRNQVSPGSNPSFTTVSKIVHFRSFH